MLTVNIIFISLTVIYFIGVKPCNAKVSCANCPLIDIDITSDADLNTQGCTLRESEACMLILTIDYTNRNDSHAVIDGTDAIMLTLTNGESQVTEITSIWFNEMRVQRTATIYCLAGASCGLDIIKRIYKDEFRLFNFQSIQNQLSDELYDSSASGSDLTCADSSNLPVACADGFCRTILDGNGFITYSSCVKKGLVPNPYGLIVTKMTMADFGGEQVSVIYTCNKPMCNSKESSQQVLQQLVAAQLIPQLMTTTVPTVTTTTIHAVTTITIPTATPTQVSTMTTTPIPTAEPTTTATATTPKNMGIKLVNNGQKILVGFFLLFSIFKLF